MPHDPPSSASYVVSPKPLGVRYLLYCDEIGRIYMEDESQRFFKLDEKRTSHQIPYDTILDGVVARKVVRDGAGAQNCNGEARGQLAFFIMDTTYVKEHELTQRPSLEYRISVVKVKMYSSVNRFLNNIVISKTMVFSFRNKLWIPVSTPSALMVDVFWNWILPSMSPYPKWTNTRPMVSKRASDIPSAHSFTNRAQR